jgi:hypothetical protein
VASYGQVERQVADYMYVRHNLMISSEYESVPHIDLVVAWVEGEREGADPWRGVAEAERGAFQERASTHQVACTSQPHQVFVP